MPDLGPDVTRLHTIMLNDAERTSKFIEAIRLAVRPGDVVVDVGAGTGVLAVAAARAGAGRVYAIEQGRIAEAARAIIAANGLSERVTLVRGRAGEIELPERADVIVSELLGSDPLSERVLQTTCDAARRFLKPGGRLVPEGLAVKALPVVVPGGERSKLLFTPEGIGEWGARYGIDFTPLAGVNRGAVLRFFLPPRDVRAWEVLAEPAALCEIDFGALRGPRVETTCTVATGRGGLLGALVVYFELRLARGLSLTTHPARCAEGNHWLNAVYLFADQIRVGAGDRIEIAYTYDDAGNGVWIDVRAPR